MNPVLADLIERFRAAQDVGVAVVAYVLGDALGVRLPPSNNEWVMICSESGLYQIRRVSDVEVYAHGYGIEISLPGLQIDFDWGDAGEADGFDGWRLWWFVRSNGLRVACHNHPEVNEWLDEAAAAGELTRDRHLYYSASHRARWTPPGDALMTEAEWLRDDLVDDQFGTMLAYLSGRVSQKRFQLFLRQAATCVASAIAQDAWCLPRLWQRQLLREIFGNPFRPTIIAPAWLNWNHHCVVRLAQAIDDEHDFSRMPILADALEEAGCDDATILRHCREPGEHARGCWLLDRLLGRE
jgi:hypothetical protein